MRCVCMVYVCMIDCVLCVVCMQLGCVSLSECM